MSQMKENSMAVPPLTRVHHTGALDYDPTRKGAFIHLVRGDHQHIAAHIEQAVKDARGNPTGQCEILERPEFGPASTSWAEYSESGEDGTWHYPEAN
jgi:hypothetical protein